ncbi:MAG: Rrf2 family transcriptional regulator [Candidatus Omnitrophica bacterium]|nr:Rrf2 family transcriptional regulator [Candidatus Omnitrophota bacterium]MDE2223510.1 Rrf2 family transcriptional regulator [Candidatus Omnitrophota bacterium]
MKVSARMDYAVRALLELGLHWPNNQPLQLRAISRKAGVPQKFLIHILIALKNLGYVYSIRGKTGGYVLGEAPAKINLADLVKQLGGLGSFDEEKRKKKNDSVSLLWQDIDKSVVNALKGVTLEDLCNRQRQQIKTLSFDI